MKKLILFFMTMLMANNFAYCSSGNTSLHKKAPIWAGSALPLNDPKFLNSIQMPGIKSKKTMLDCIGQIAGYSKQDIIKKGCCFQSAKEKFLFHHVEPVIVQREDKTWRYGVVTDEAVNGKHKVFVELTTNAISLVDVADIGRINANNQFGFDAK